MTSTPDDVRAALLLTNRVVRLDAKPLSAREFWKLVERVRPAELAASDVDQIAEAAGVEHDEAERYRSLLDAVTALTFETERLSDGGVTLVSAFDDRFPRRLHERLGPACPTFLLVAGPIEWLARGGLGVVGSRDADAEALGLASAAAKSAAERGWPVVSGLARGVDQAAMAAGFEVGGAVVGVAADGIVRAARSHEVRSRVHAGELCLASPYAPGAPFSAGNALGRNKIIYGLSEVTFVAASQTGSGGTWSGATEALRERYGRVAAWSGDGATDGNRALVARGAAPVTDLGRVFDLEAIAASSEQRSLFE